VNAYNYYSMEYRQGLRGAKKERRARVGGGVRSAEGEGQGRFEDEAGKVGFYCEIAVLRCGFYLGSQQFGHATVNTVSGHSVI
jgi:hypothetical protein